MMDDSVNKYFVCVPQMGQNAFLAKKNGIQIKQMKIVKNLYIHTRNVFNIYCLMWLQNSYYRFLTKRNEHDRKKSWHTGNNQNIKA